MHEPDVNVRIWWEWKNNKIEDHAGRASETPNKSECIKQKRSNEYNCVIAAFRALLDISKYLQIKLGKKIGLTDLKKGDQGQSTDLQYHGSEEFFSFKKNKTKFMEVAEIFW